MARIVFEVEIDASARKVAEALITQQGIAGWWTDDVTLPDGVGATMTLGFPVAPLPFQLRVEEAGERRVAWCSVGDFPPHWVGTKLIWALTPTRESTTVHFAHEGWASDDGPFASSALTWGRLMDSLKLFAETGTPKPLFHAA
jgi:uncharacterized protein YndB with AHSA1/START domain